MAEWISSQAQLPAPSQEVVVWWQPFPHLTRGGTLRIGRVDEETPGHWLLRGSAGILTPPEQVPLWFPLPPVVTEAPAMPKGKPRPARRVQEFSVVRLPDGRVGWYTRHGPGQKPTVMLGERGVAVTPDTKLTVLQTPALLASAYVRAWHNAQVA
jgi:hypothetical protein